MSQIINLKSKSEQYPVLCEYAGGCFRLNEQGLSFLGKDKDGNTMPPRWICSPLLNHTKLTQGYYPYVLSLALNMYQCLTHLLFQLSCVV
ncbi:hypothetical protein B1207_10450 [Legionella quinlivanii]|uniref:Uncharacterized protein n=1 Tax=Legionella quinlivanii TaxID=45073 RepID=A0A364LI12_9GAMM|nr:hypothetical protein B1207_10450 [Legionella quinlivanii]